MSEQQPETYNWSQIMAERRERRQPTSAPPPVQSVRALRGTGTPYALAALDGELEAVQQAVKGTRNDTLNRAAFNLAQLVAAGDLDQDLVDDQLRAAGIRVGLAPGEVAKTLASGRRGGLQQPRVVPELAPFAAQVVEVPAAELEQPGIENVGGGGVLERLVQRELLTLRAREEARRRLSLEVSAARDLPTLVRLDDFLSVPDSTLTHRIEGLWPTGGRVVFAARRKAGKSTTVGNLLRSLADGTPFLDRFATRAVGRVVLLDDELDEGMLRRWLRDHQVANQAAVELVPLRGRVSRFDILDADVRSRWAAHLGPGDVLVLDCLRPALDALGLSEDKDAGRFLEALDELTTEAGIAETLVVHHMGHSGERSRGDSRIVDWPDALWKLVPDGEDEADTNGRRYFSAYGRDVDQPELQLAYDQSTRHLSVAGGSRRDTRHEGVLAEVLEFLESSPGASQRSIEAGVEARREVVRDAVRLGVQAGRIERRPQGRAFLHYVVDTSKTNAPERAPAHGRTEGDVCAHAPIGAQGAHTHAEGEQEGDAPRGAYVLPQIEEVVGE